MNKTKRIFLASCLSTFMVLGVSGCDLLKKLIPGSNSDSQGNGTTTSSNNDNDSNGGGNGGNGGGGNSGQYGTEMTPRAFAELFVTFTNNDTDYSYTGSVLANTDYFSNNSFPSKAADLSSEVNTTTSLKRGNVEVQSNQTYIDGLGSLEIDSTNQIISSYTVSQMILTQNGSQLINSEYTSDIYYQKAIVDEQEIVISIDNTQQSYGNAGFSSDSIQNGNWLREVPNRTIAGLFDSYIVDTAKASLGIGTSPVDIYKFYRNGNKFTVVGKGIVQSQASTFYFNDQTGEYENVVYGNVSTDVDLIATFEITNQKLSFTLSDSRNEVTTVTTAVSSYEEGDIQTQISNTVSEFSIDNKNVSLSPIDVSTYTHNY